MASSLHGEDLFDTMPARFNITRCTNIGKHRQAADIARRLAATIFKARDAVVNRRWRNFTGLAKRGKT